MRDTVGDAVESRFVNVVVGVNVNVETLVSVDVLVPVPLDAATVMAPPAADDCPAMEDASSRNAARTTCIRGMAVLWRGRCIGYSRSREWSCPVCHRKRILKLLRCPS
jgi:hypothetical protein